MINRRTILKGAVATGALAASSGHYVKGSPGAKRKFTIDLTPGAIGVKVPPTEMIGFAKSHGFESIQPNASFLASIDSAARKVFKDELGESGLVWGAAGLPVDFRNDEAKFKEGLKVLPAQATALKEVGATRVGTWLKPFHDSLTYLENFHQHVERIREITKILGDHEIRFGLEYVGTKSLWTSKSHSFIHSMAETKELIAEVGQANLGFVLDSWHWYTAGETAEDILTLENSDVVACDLNDAPTGIAVEDQLDNQRELPAATGVINIESFLQALVKIAYNGPVRAEPFNKPLNAMDDGPAAAATAKAIRKAVEIAGV